MSIVNDRDKSQLFEISEKQQSQEESEFSSVDIESQQMLYLSSCNSQPQNMGFNDSEDHLISQRPEKRMTNDHLNSERIERSSNSFNNIPEKNKESCSAYIAGRRVEPSNHLFESE